MLRGLTKIIESSEMEDEGGGGVDGSGGGDGVGGGGVDEK